MLPGTFPIAGNDEWVFEVPLICNLFEEVRLRGCFLDLIFRNFDQKELQTHFRGSYSPHVDWTTGPLPILGFGIVFVEDGC